MLYGGGSTNRKSHPVMTKAPNAKGIYDMTGNVEEYVWGKYTGVGGDPSYGASCGGRWDYVTRASYDDELAVSYFNTTFTSSPTSRSDTEGFRVVRNAN